MEEVLLLCDVCNGGYHIHCLAPPLTSVPEGDWTCARCSDHEDLVSDEEGEGEKERTTCLEALLRNEAGAQCECGALASSRLPRVEDCAPAPGRAATWPSRALWTCGACWLTYVERIYAAQRQALVELAPEMAQDLPALPHVEAVLSWHDPPRGPPVSHSKRGYRFGPGLDALLAFALDRFGYSERHDQREFKRAWQEYFQCVPDETKLMHRYSNQRKAQQVNSPLPAAPRANGEADEKGARIRAALAPYKRSEWPEPKTCVRCAISIVSGETHACQPCGGVLYCSTCAPHHSGTHNGVPVVMQWEVRLPPRLDTKLIKALAKQLNVTEKELRRYI